MSGDLLLTGATGFVGMEVLGRYLERTDRTIITPIRAADDDAAVERMSQTLYGLFGDRARHYEDRVEAVAADLTAPRLGLTPAREAEVARRVDQIIHSAASVSFALPLEEARAINLEGTRRMLELAEMTQAHGGLSRYAQISTAYVSGTHAGRFTESDHTVGQTFRNSYEQSKFEAESLVRSAALPATILRPSIVVGDRRSGWTNAFNVLYWPLRAFAMGVFKAFPAIPSAPVDVVSIDYVADGIYAVCESGEGIGETYHLTASRHASSVNEITELASAYFNKPKPHVLPPAEFAEYAAKNLDDGTSKALAQSAAYFPYFTIDTVFDDTRSRKLLEPAGVTASPLHGYMSRLLDFATSTRWGKRPVSRVESLQMA